MKIGNSDEFQKGHIFFEVIFITFLRDVMHRKYKKSHKRRNEKMIFS